MTALAWLLVGAAIVPGLAVAAGKFIAVGSIAEDFSSDSETDFAAWRDGLANARDSLGDDALGEVGEGDRAAGHVAARNNSKAEF